MFSTTSNEDSWVRLRRFNWLQATLTVMRYSHEENLASPRNLPIPRQARSRASWEMSAAKSRSPAKRIAKVNTSCW